MDFISDMLQDLLNILFSYTGDLGVAIVIVTLIVKLILMPLSIKQRLAMSKQQELAKKVNYIKDKYKNNTKELENQLQKHSQESIKSMLGCFTAVLQMPIIYALYRTFLNMTYVSDSILIPWISNLNVADNLFIIPCIYTLTMLAPNLVCYIPYFNDSSKVVFNKNMIISTVIISFILTVKTPVSICLYFITSSIYSLLEDICMKVYVKEKNASVIN